MTPLCHVVYKETTALQPIRGIIRFHTKCLNMHSLSTKFQLCRVYTALALINTDKLLRLVNSKAKQNIIITLLSCQKMLIYTHESSKFTAAKQNIITKPCP